MPIKNQLARDIQYRLKTVSKSAPGATSRALYAPRHLMGTIAVARGWYPPSGVRTSDLLITRQTRCQYTKASIEQAGVRCADKSRPGLGRIRPRFMCASYARLFNRRFGVLAACLSDSSTDDGSKPPRGVPTPGYSNGVGQRNRKLFE